MKLAFDHSVIQLLSNTVVWVCLILSNVKIMLKMARKIKQRETKISSERTKIGLGQKCKSYNSITR